MIPEEVLNAVKEIQIRENEIFEQRTAPDKTITLSGELWGFVNGLRLAKSILYNHYAKIGENLSAECHEKFEDLTFTV